MEPDLDIEAAVFRRLVSHLQKRSDVQNIDLMILAGFCRNCLANWTEDAAREQGKPITRDEARRFIYGMDYERWKARFQKPASAAQLAALKAAEAKNAEEHAEKNARSHHEGTASSKGLKEG